MNVAKHLFIIGLFYSAIQFGRCQSIAETDALLERSAAAVERTSASLRTCRTNAEMVELFFDRCAVDLERCRQRSDP